MYEDDFTKYSFSLPSSHLKVPKSGRHSSYAADAATTASLVQQRRAYHYWYVKKVTVIYRFFLNVTVAFVIGTVFFFRWYWPSARVAATAPTTSKSAEIQKSQPTQV